MLQKKPWPVMSEQAVVKQVSLNAAIGRNRLRSLMIPRISQKHRSAMRRKFIVVLMSAGKFRESPSEFVETCTPDQRRQLRQLWFQRCKDVGGKGRRR